MSHSSPADHSPPPAGPDPAALTQALKAEAHRLGFGLAGACQAVAPPGVDRLRDWLAAGRHGEMQYMAERAEAYTHPNHVLDGAKSLLVLAFPYRTVEPVEPGPGQGRVARYAWGADYHDLIHDRLHQLADWLRVQRPEAKVRGVVDTAPLLEREFAQLAGLGWIGKNTLLLNREIGSFFFLAVLLTSEVLEYDAAHEVDHCGTCTACLDACPTKAFDGPYQLDATKCISYLTIEHRSEIPESLRPLMGDWVFGCDVCQDVCPWNRKAPVTTEPELQPLPGMNPLDLNEIMSLDDATFRARFRHTPIWRAKREGLHRNAAVVLGN